MQRVTKSVFLLIGVLVAAPSVLAQDAGAASTDARWSMLQTYCIDCHNATDWAGGVAFDTMAPADVPHGIDVWEAAVRKLRGNLMPPPGNKQPTQAQKDALVGWLETSLDARHETPRAGHVTAQRMNRTEYANAVRSLLGVEIKVEDLLPPEIEMDGFDNIAAAPDHFAVLPRPVHRRGAFHFAARGRRTPKLTKTTYLSSTNETTDMPLGSRGGFKFKHFFPADGEYHISILDDLTGGLYTNPALFRQTIVIFLDGRQVFRGDVGGKEDLGLADREAGQGREKINGRFANIPVRATSGTHEFTVTSVERAHALSDENIGSGNANSGARINSVEVAGPFGETTIGHSLTRDKIFVCTPKNTADEKPCATKIAQRLATQAYRRPVTDADVAKLMAFYDAGRKDIRGFRRRRAGNRDGSHLQSRFPLPDHSATGRRQTAATTGAARTGVAPFLLPVERPARR